MTILLLLKGANVKPNSEHGHVIDIFETKKEFQDFLIHEIKRLEEIYKSDEVQDKEILLTIDEYKEYVEKNGFMTFHLIWNTYRKLCDESRSFIIV